MANPEDQPDSIREALDIILGKDNIRYRQVSFQIPYGVAFELAIFLRSEQMRVGFRRRGALQEGVIFPESEQLWWIATDKLPKIPEKDEEIDELRRKISVREPFPISLSAAELEVIGEKLIQDIHEEDEYGFFDSSWVPYFSNDPEFQQVPEYTKRMARELIGAFQQTQRAFVLVGGIENSKLKKRITGLKRQKDLERR